jgi:hypothetical protein
VCPSTDSTANG